MAPWWASAAILGYALDASATGDYDSDDDRLIEISSLAQLDAVRWDLNGDGEADDEAYAAAYAAAFPDALAAMGCPAANAPAPPCRGYELGSGPGSSLVLDFATTDDYADGGAGWLPIGSPGPGFRAVFKGNGHAIRNLAINRAGIYNIGLFFALLSGGEIHGVRLLDVDVQGDENAGALVGDNVGTITASEAHGSVRGRVNVGGLAGVNQGIIRESAATGSVAASLAVGGLVGRGTTGSTIAASYSASDVAGTEQVGGLVGRLEGSLTATYATGIVRGTRAVGGLAGEVTAGKLTANYASGAVSGTIFVGGLIGSTGGDDPGPVVEASYWDMQTTGQRNSAAGSAKTPLQLRTRTDATGIYAAWDELLVRAGGGRDDPWHFGTAAQYPVLNIGAVRASEQRAVVARTVPAPLVNYALEGATVRIALPRGRAFHPTISNADFTLAAAPAGVVLGGAAVRSSPAAADLTLSLAGDPGAGAELSELSVTAKATGHTGSTDLTTGAMSVAETAQPALVFDARLLAVPAGASVDYTVALATRPSATVTVTIEATPPASVSPSTIRFDADDWSSAQTVQIQTDYHDGPRVRTATLTHMASGGNYSGLMADLSVHVLRMLAGVSASPTALTIEEGEHGSYALRLNTRPNGMVMVTVVPDSEGVDPEPSFAAFDAENWNQPARIRVKALVDADAEDGTATLNHAVVGYGEVTTGPPVAVTTLELPSAAMLSALRVYPGKLVPEFDPEISDYAVRVPRGMATVLAAASSPRAQVAIEPQDASPMPGHQIDLANDPNVVVVQVNNGARAVAYTLRMARAASRRPEVAALFPSVALKVGASETIDLRRGFTDPDGDPMAYTASSDRPEFATVEVSGARAHIVGRGNGTAMVLVRATDSAGWMAMQAVQVSVGDLSETMPVPGG